MPMIRLTLKPFAGALTYLRGRRGVMHVIGVVAVRLITKVQPPPGYTYTTGNRILRAKPGEIYLGGDFYAMAARLGVVINAKMGHLIECENGRILAVF